MFYRLFFILIMCAYATKLKAQAYKIYRANDKQEVQVEDILKRVQPGTVLLFGEQHTDSVAHLLELDIWIAVHKAFGQHAVLSLEMFERDVQPVLDEYLTKLISEKNFRKEARAWNNYDDYRPMVNYAKEQDLKVIAANTPARYVNRVTYHGLDALSAIGQYARKHYLPPLPIDTLKGKYATLFAEILGGHEMSGMHLYQSQNLWDATMAWSIHEVLKQDKRSVVFQVNGKFHSDFHTGLVERLVRDYGHQTLTISCLPVADISKPDWQELAEIADFVILTVSPTATQE